MGLIIRLARAPHFARGVVKPVVPLQIYGLFTLLDLDSDSDSDSDRKPNGYIIPYITFHTAQSQSQIPMPTVDYKNRIETGLRMGIYICECK